MEKELENGSIEKKVTVETKKETLMDDLSDRPFPEKKEKKKGFRSKEWSRKKFLMFLIIGIVSFFGGIGMLMFGLFGIDSNPISLSFSNNESEEQKEITYSSLTGEALREGDSNTAPVFCMQTPNGIDGARPQAGLTEAGVIFEAIAEAGITRFAAIYQNPSSAIIGPIRSLRPYYLDWDIPFDCIVVHAGGSANAMAALAAGGYKDLDESTQYMFRGTYSGRLWNNLFTTTNYLKQFAEDNGYTTSEIKGFLRMTPEESKKVRINNLAKERLDILKGSDNNTSEIEAKVSNISMSLGSSPSFDINYTYDPESNSYRRGYATGVPHEVYQCTTEDLGEKNPEDVCNLVTLSPTVVVGMVVQEKKAPGNYYEDITTVGTGDAYIFQNGDVIRGSWSKNSREDQIKFFDGEGNEVKLAPGQTFISAVPSYGSVEY